MKTNLYKITNNGENTIDVFSTGTGGYTYAIPLQPGVSISIEAPDHPDLEFQVSTSLEKEPTTPTVN